MFDNFPHKPIFVSPVDEDTQELDMDAELHGTVLLDGDLPELPDNNWDWSEIVELLPDSARRIVQGVCAIIALLASVTAGVFTALNSANLIADSTAFVALTIISIVTGVIAAVAGALGFTSKPPKAMILHEVRI
jgi:hypothetical protein